MRRNGFEAAKNPILRPLDTIECRDAVSNADGTRAEWPEADAVVGNPPFLGNKKMIRELGEDYTRTLRNSWPEVRSEEHTSELQSLMRISYAVFCLKKKKNLT